jgi:hypothetical protein
MARAFVRGLRAAEEHARRPVREDAHDLRVVGPYATNKLRARAAWANECDHARHAGLTSRQTTVRISAVRAGADTAGQQNSVPFIRIPAVLEFSVAAMCATSARRRSAPHRRGSVATKLEKERVGGGSHIVAEHMI